MDLKDIFGVLQQQQQITIDHTNLSPWPQCVHVSIASFSCTHFIFFSACLLIRLYMYKSVR